MMHFFKSLEIPLWMMIAAGILLLLLIIIVCVHLAKRRKKKEEQTWQMKQRMREEVLDKMLVNPMQKIEKKGFEKQRQPFQVEYSQGDNRHIEKGHDVTLQITESTELSRKKYMFRCQEKVSIGNQFGTVTILSGDADPQQVYCQIFFYEGANYVRGTGKYDVFLKRKGKQIVINQTGIMLRSEDIFTVGKTVFQITFLK